MTTDIHLNALYRADVEYVASLALPWDQMSNVAVLITGASGMLGSFMVDVLMHRNLTAGMQCKVYALGRNLARAQKRFGAYWNSADFEFIAHDINTPLTQPLANLGYIFHLASNTHPVAYATDPIGTITTNIIGTHNLLELAASQHIQRFVFASSNEVYGENRGDVEKFDEEYCGYIDPNTLRAGYPESKRCGEALCQAYLSQKGVDVVIPRLTRSYGPTVKPEDSKAISQFINNALRGEDIVLKSAGHQQYSFTYVADAIAGLLTVALKGTSGNAYNIADSRSDISLRELATIIAHAVGRTVTYDLPNATEQKGFSKATKALLDSTKLQGLGWTAKYDIAAGIHRTLSIMQG
ncbi:NAD-dependent epimerase/dehydratase family protein [Lacticaseibacillus thailandensis]|uniref:Epimerase dehydratase n=1 Tax=Lacticaseibacillus thailandensis DSM 22698 = JCM 13996 TaxID=1423810 RepID=A0A0R2C9B5_9LACO|nr:NAD-dependent epimerase/dehydratase family protein [Lacticaseibacillus thailandensis]KRM87952.1 epimerase dehydratase [Lacticaseibacillus thailandensis DSM 22698 = JCM 13996]